MLPDFIENPDPFIYLNDNYAVVDFETTAISFGSAITPKNELLMGVVEDRTATSLYLPSAEAVSSSPLLQQATFLVAHNAKFELQWLKRCGWDLAHVLVWDTQIAEYILQGNKKLPLNLDAVAKRRGLGGKSNTVSRLIDLGVDPKYLPEGWVHKYCARDVQITHQIFLQQRAELKQRNMLPLMFSRCLLTPVLADIEFNGMHLDQAAVRQVYFEHIEKLADLEHALKKYGEINWNSTKQLAKFLYEDLKFKELTNRKGEPIRTATGNPATDADTLLQLKATNKKQREFLAIYAERNKLQAAISKNLEFFYGTVMENGGIFHAQFNQTITATNRLSSSGRPTKFKEFAKPKSVQFQNLPRQFKSLFSPRDPSWFISEADGAGLEFTIAGFLGQDYNASKAIAERFDVHQFTADTLTAAGEPRTRQEAKANTFKPLYGGTSGTAAQQAYYAAFRERYPDLAATQQAWVDYVLRYKHLDTLTGFRFYFPDTEITRSGYVTNTASIYNYPIQQFATADVIPATVVYLWHRMKAAKLQSFLVNTVHDSVISEVHPEEVPQYKDFVIQAFTTDVYNYFKKVYNIEINVQLGLGFKVGSHWGKGKEDKIYGRPEWKMLHEVD